MEPRLDWGLAWYGLGFSIGLGFTHRALSSSFLWLIFRILQGNPNKELLRAYGLGFRVSGFVGVLQDCMDVPCEKTQEILEEAVKSLGF